MVRECDEGIRRKAPKSLPDLAHLLEPGKVEVVESTASGQDIKALDFILYLPDALVLAEAMAAKVDWFITRDKVHFLRTEPGPDLNIKIGSPGDLLQALGDEFSQV